MELSDADKRSSTEKKRFSEVFDELFPTYLALGMTAKQYWEGDNALPYFFRRAYEIKQKKELREQNYMAWLQGMYIAEAIASCLSKNAHYPKEPYPMEKEPEPKTEAEEEQKVMTAAEKFAAFIFAKNKERQNKQPPVVNHPAEPIIFPNQPEGPTIISSDKT